MNSSEILSNIFISDLAGFERVGILGFGREGKSTFHTLRRYFPNMHISIGDKSNVADERPELKLDANISLYIGDQHLAVLELCDVVFVSPGVPLHEIYVPENVVLTSQTDFIFRNFGHKIIAVTGTKGKSTTSSLIAHILKGSNPEIPLAGNIGIPPFEVIQSLVEQPFGVFEVSSHQLQLVNSSPRVALLLNLFPEHLDYYPDEGAYFSAKRRIFKFQSAKDIVVLNVDEHPVCDYFLQQHSKAIVMRYSLKDHGLFGAFLKEDMLCFRDENEHVYQLVHRDAIQLKGNHNISNCLAAICAARACKEEFNTIQHNLCTFNGLPHRMERIEGLKGTVFYNDSIATIPEATLAALESLRPVTTLILGGMDRGLNYDEFIDSSLQSEVKYFCLYGEAGQRMFQMYQTKAFKGKEIKYFPDFTLCVEQAIRFTKTGETCLLSPAASSYDQFRNFEERGDVFRSLVTSK